jgi:uncharacterized membrane protein
MFRNRSALPPMSFEPLEHRQMLAADLMAEIVSPVAGGELSFGPEHRALITVTNAGDARVRDVGLSLFASTDDTFDASDVLLGQRRLSTVSAGERETEDIEFRLPGNLAAGSYKLFAIVDPENAWRATRRTTSPLAWP